MSLHEGDWLKERGHMMHTTHTKNLKHNLIGHNETTSETLPKHFYQLSFYYFRSDTKIAIDGSVIFGIKMKLLLNNYSQQGLQQQLTVCCHQLDTFLRLLKEHKFDKRYAK